MRVCALINRKDAVGTTSNKVAGIAVYCITWAKSLDDANFDSDKQKWLLFWTAAEAKTLIDVMAPNNK